MWVDDVILLQQEFKRTLDDESIDAEIRHGMLVAPELYWSDGVKEFANKYGFTDELGSQDRYIIGTIAAGRYTMATIRDLLTPRDPERASLICAVEEEAEKEQFCRKKKMVSIDGTTEDKIEPLNRGDVGDLVDIFLNTCQELYSSDKDTYKEVYENLLKTFRDNVKEAQAELDKVSSLTSSKKKAIEEILLKNLPKTLIYNAK